MGYGYVTPTDGFTIELWFKRDAISVSETLINSRTQASVNWTTNGINTGYGRQLLVEILSTGALAVTIINEGASSGTSVEVATDPSPGGYATDNEWHHLAFRLGTNKIAWSLFLDGEEYMNDNTSAAVNWNPGILTFGAQYAPHMGDHGTSIWSKWLSYIAVYDVALSNNRIFEHYTAGSGGTVYYGDDEVTRLNRIADWAEIPEQAREFEPAMVEMQGIQVQDANALTAFQETAGAATGLIFADGQSRLVYHNRRHRYNRWNVTTLAESTDSAPEVGLTFTIDDSNIYNDVRGSRPYGSTVRIVNEVSKAAHGRKTYSFSVPVTTHEELYNAVTWISAHYRDPVVRVSSINFRAESSDLIEWIGTGGLTVGDHITLDELPSEAPEVTMEFIVEKISLNVDVKNRVWNVGLELSPYHINRVFQVGVSHLGTEWKVAY